MHKVYYGTIVHTPTLSWVEIHPRTLIVVNDAGTIVYIEHNHRSANPRNHAAAKVGVTSNDVEFNDLLKNPLQFLTPGFVDTHIHASQYPNVGAGLGVPLLEWLKEYTFPMETAFTLEQNVLMARDVYTKVIQRTLQNGTTCASYFATIDLRTTKLFTDLLLEKGQRAFVGKVCMDHNDMYPSYCESTEQSIETLEKIIEYIQDKCKTAAKAEGNQYQSIVAPIITPRFAPSCSQELLELLGTLSEAQELPIQTHIAENLKEIELMKELFPEFEDYASVYDHFKLLTERTVLAHAIHLTDRECDIIREKKCLISHCPTSNTFISLGEAPIRKYLKHGINVGLGTDLSAGFDVLILEVMKNSILVLQHLAMKKGDGVKLTISEVLYMATQGGAKAVGLGDKIGTFQVGKQWDAQMINLNAPNSYIDVFEWQVPSDGEWRKMEDLLGKWVFNGDDRNCEKVWVNGKMVIDKTDGWVLV